MSTILILHCSAGAGHRSVARAIDEALASGSAHDEASASGSGYGVGLTNGSLQNEILKSGFAYGETATAGEACPGATAVFSSHPTAQAGTGLRRDEVPHHLIADSLCFSGLPFRTMCSKGYEFFARHIRWACGVGYVLLDKPSSRSLLVRTVQKTSNLAVEGLAGFLAENAVDVVCCTHFMPMSLIGDLRRKGRYGGRLHVCVTDYDIQGLWFEPEVDRYYVATDKGAARLAAWGIPRERIAITGIPVRRDFAALAPAPVRGQDDSRPLRVLFSAGSLKTREALRLLHETAAAGVPLDLTVVTGRTPSLRKALAGYTPPPHVRLDIRGFEPHMERLMADADILLSKPGGITCTESLCAGLPMLFVHPIPMQEVHNARILEQAGAGLRCFRPGSAGKALAALAADRAGLAAMRKACLRLAHPEAAVVVGAALLEGVHPTSPPVRSARASGRGSAKPPR